MRSQTAAVRTLQTRLESLSLYTCTHSPTRQTDKPGRILQNKYDPGRLGSTVVHARIGNRTACHTTDHKYLLELFFACLALNPLLHSAFSSSSQQQKLFPASAAVLTRPTPEVGDIVALYDIPAKPTAHATAGVGNVTSGQEPSSLTTRRIYPPA